MVNTPLFIIDAARPSCVEVTITPRAYPFSLRCMGDFRTKYAMIGMAYVAGEYPLYYDAVNEKGLGVAGLNFVGNAVYHPAQDGKSNVAQFELIPWLLGSCATLAEVRTLLAKTNIVNIPFSVQLPLAQLHWLIAVGRVVVNALVSVAAACVERDLVLAAVQLTAAALLLDSVQDVEELPDADKGIYY